MLKVVTYMSSRGVIEVQVYKTMPDGGIQLYLESVCKPDEIKETRAKLYAEAQELEKALAEQLPLVSKEIF